MPLIKVSDVHKEYELGGELVKALGGVNLEIEKGEFTSIIGKSGSGKSTLMHIIGLLDRPTRGEIYYREKNVFELSDAARAQLRGAAIGFVFQSFNLLARTSALDNVVLPTTYVDAKAGDKPANQRALEILEKLGLGDRLKNTPGQLSGGQQQRVAIARALVNDPDIILADEPTGNLDTKSGEEVIKILGSLHNEGKTVIIVTHDEDLAAVTKRRIRITDGKIVEDKRV